MKTNITKENEYAYTKEFSLLQSFSKSFNCSDAQDKRLNSTKIRHLIDCADVPCISTKTFDANIRLLNEKLPCNKANINPARQPQLRLNDMPLHTYVFYQRLPFCLNLNSYEEELYTKEVENSEQKEHRQKLNLILGLESTKSSPYYFYTFDIHNYYMPPFFAPLFVGILDSLKKEKTSWQSFRKSTLDIADFFCNENHPEVNQFLPENADIRRELYTYWLELYFPDELFDLISEFDKIIHGNDRILSYNLNIMTDSLSNELFLTRINQEKFLQHMKSKLELYLNTPLANPTIDESKDWTLCKEYSHASNKYHTEEICLLREWALK